MQIQMYCNISRSGIPVTVTDGGGVCLSFQCKGLKQGENIIIMSKQIVQEFELTYPDIGS